MQADTVGDAHSSLVEACNLNTAVADADRRTPCYRVSALFAKQHLKLWKA